MQKDAIRLPSGNKVATSYNREMIRVPDLTFDTKGELRRRIELLYWEKNRDKEIIERVNEENRLLRAKILELQEAEIRLHRGGDALMVVC